MLLFDCLDSGIVAMVTETVLELFFAFVVITLVFISTKILFTLLTSLLQKVSKLFL